MNDPFAFLPPSTENKVYKTIDSLFEIVVFSITKINPITNPIELNPTEKELKVCRH